MNAQTASEAARDAAGPELFRYEDLLNERSRLQAALDRAETLLIADGWSIFRTEHDSHGAWVRPQGLSHALGDLFDLIRATLGTLAIITLFWIFLLGPVLRWLGMHV